jgi:DNA-directed RNA polymerase specialized sigma24 family protein
VVALYYLDGRRSREVAEALDISEALVRQRLVRARLMLHERMSRDEK